MKFLILLCVVAYVGCNPVAQQPDESVLKMVLGNVVNCNSDITLCLKEQALKATQRVGTLRQIKLFDGVTVLNSEPREAKSLELSEDTEVRRKQVTEKLWESTSSLLGNSDLELSWGGPEEEDEASSREFAEEGRGKKKKKEIKKKLKLLIPLAIIGKIKAILLVVVSLVIIAASLAKLAILAKIAFIAKAIALIKLLLSKKLHHEEDHTAWVSAPAHSHEHIEHIEHGHGHPEVSHGWENQGSGWSRSNDASKLAYSAYAQ